MWIVNVHTNVCYQIRKTQSILHTVKVNWKIAYHETCVKAIVFHYLNNATVPQRQVSTKQLPIRFWSSDQPFNLNSRNSFFIWSLNYFKRKYFFLYESRLEYTINYFFFSLYRQKFNYTKIKAVYDFFIEHLRLSFHQFSNWNKAFSAVYLHVGERNISVYVRQTAKVIKRQISWKSYNLWHLSINKYL